MVCGETSSSRPTAPALTTRISHALCRESRFPLLLSSRAGVGFLALVDKEFRPLTSQASRAETAYEPSGTILSLSPLPISLSTGFGSIRAA